MYEISLYINGPYLAKRSISWNSATIAGERLISKVKQIVSRTCLTGVERGAQEAVMTWN